MYMDNNKLGIITIFLKNVLFPNCILHSSKPHPAATEILG